MTRLPSDYLDSLAADEATEREAGRPSLAVLDDSQVEHLPPMSWLADQIIPRGGLVALYGAPGSGKSFVALGLTLSIAAGVPWLGHDVRQGGALYFAAEGRGGLGQRVQSWKAQHGLAGQTLGVGFVTTAVNLLEPWSAKYIANAVETSSAIRSPCQLIVIDTLARSMIGDENDTGDMSQLIASVDRIRELTDATVLLVHHTRKDSDLERGSSALRGGVDTLIFCEEGDDGRQLVCQKQKDAEAFAPIPFSLVAGFGSCVATSTGGDSPAGLADLEGKLTPRRLIALRSLSEAFTTKGATRTEWKAATKLPESTIYHVTAWLVKEGYVAENGSRFTLTPSGKGALATHSNASKSPNRNGSLIASNPPPIGFQNLRGTPVTLGPPVEKEGNPPTNSPSDDGYYADLLAEADERIGMREDA